MKEIVFIFYGGIIPCDGGNKKLAYEILHYLHSLQKYRIHLVLIENGKVDLSEYKDLCTKLSVFKEPVSIFWLHVLNKPFSLLGLINVKVFIFSLYLRIKLQKIMSDADFILINYVIWHRVVPKQLLKKALVITHDIQFYRSWSFCRNRNVFSKLLNQLNKLIEIYLLKKFSKTIVLADYEEKILLDSGLRQDKILKIGMPLRPPVVEYNAFQEYDFLMVAGNSFQNIEGLNFFVNNIANRMDNFPIIAIAGNICESDCVISLAINHPEIVLLGFVSDLGAIYAHSKLIIGTLISGSGVKVKIVEAMLYSKPVITTNKGLEGITWSNDGIINIDNYSIETTLRMTRDCLADEKLRRDMGEIARTTVASTFSQDKCLENLIVYFDNHQ